MPPLARPLSLAPALLVGGPELLLLLSRLVRLGLAALVVVTGKRLLAAADAHVLPAQHLPGYYE